MTDQWAVQISPKIGDTLINVRGEDVQSVVQALGDLADVSGQVAEALNVITAAGNASAAMNGPASSAPSAANWQPPAQPAAASPGNAPSCEHGQRQFKQTKTGKKLWECPLAAANWKDPNACKAVWIN
ncbi:hypothetical protein [Dactylosporangium sp. CA-139066]|uniref:hypothetical protein n=1 Tax=Dactylosporangium sp. CA-139066 TaxID=3239930 RepID=UPI003D8E6C87